MPLLSVRCQPSSFSIDLLQLVPRVRRASLIALALFSAGSRSRAHEWTTGWIEKVPESVVRTNEYELSISICSMAGNKLLSRDLLATKSH